MTEQEKLIIEKQDVADLVKKLQVVVEEYAFKVPGIVIIGALEMTKAQFTGFSACQAWEETKK
jgi:hypothetical protein